jgi:crossover junction endodeoxyribonuclease RuvC
MGVVDALPGNRLVLVDVTVVRTPTGASPGIRLAGIAAAAEEWLERWGPDAVAVERVFSQHNVRTVMGTAQAAGVVLAAAGRRELTVTVHTPTEVKAAVTGSGRASKDQVATMVARLLHLSAAPAPADAADALALAICHLWRAPSALRGVAG